MTKNSGLVSLINHLGNDRIKFQIVGNSLEGNITLVEDGITRFSMLTESENISPDDLISGQFRKTGILLWVDPADVNEWMNSKD